MPDVVWFIIGSYLLWVTFFDDSEPPPPSMWD